MFCRPLYILPLPLVFVSGLQTVSCPQTWKFSRKSLAKSLCESLCGPRVHMNNQCFPTALNPTCAACVFKWTSNCLVDKLETFSKKLEETNKIALETTINIRLYWCLCVYTLNWLFGAWGSWKRGQSPYQFPAELRPQQKSSGGLIWHQQRPTHYRENLEFFWLYNTGHPTHFSFVERKHDLGLFWSTIGDQ